MIQLSPVLPNHLLAVYLSTSLLCLGMCLLSAVALFRTKKTPYPTKLLSLGVLAFDSLFIVSSNCGKYFDYDNSFILRHLSRGFMTAALFNVGFMSLERLFALNWTNTYIRVVTKGRTTKACVAIIVGSFLQFILIRIVGCYTQGRVLYCPVLGPSYFLVSTCSWLLISSASFVKVYTIVRNKSTTGMIKEYRGTIASFLYLINSTVAMTIYLGIAVYYTLRIATGEQTRYDDEMVNVTDSVYLLNCIFDALVFTLWFKEARLQILKIFSKLCVRLQPSVEKMRLEVFSIITYNPDEAENTTRSEIILNSNE